ncbi:MAG: penicillin-binding protein 2 [Bacteroidaceae bacterium]|nr:penicillin-binding protein 2 [Bacteroidaceae bacterium]
MNGLEFEKRRFIIGLIATVIIAVYLVRLLTMQIMSDDYKKNADSNAFQKEVLYPARGLIMDRKGRLLVYNEPTYNIMVTMNDQIGVDTADFCRTVGMTQEEYEERMAEIKDSRRNVGYSRFTPQQFLTQIPAKEFSVIQEKLYKFRGFSIEKRAVRRYATTCCAHVLGDVAEVNPAEIDSDAYYRKGDYIGKLGVERSYEKDLRGVKGLHIHLRDARGRIKGRYQEGRFDRYPEPGRNLTLGIDRELQALGERLMRNKIGSIVAIEPSTGEVLCMVSSPTFDPHLLIGPERGRNYRQLQADPYKPLLNRAIMGQYPPGSTFKTTQGLTFLQEHIITPGTYYPCSHGFWNGRTHVGCHGHYSPVELNFAIQTSCNSYFCWGFYHMVMNKKKYGSYSAALTRWKDYMVSMGFGYRLGVDLPGEKRGMIPNAQYYDKWYKSRWNALTIISDAIGQGEVMLTPLQVANLGATIANRGYYYVPHVVSKVEGRAIDTLYTRRRHTMVEPRYYEMVVRGMRSAVLGGTCKGANLPGIEVCGKTGTAENRGKDHSVFMGFAPMNNPRIAISVYVENGGFGAHMAVPMAALMLEQYLTGELSPASQAKADSYAQKVIYYGTKH